MRITPKTYLHTFTFVVLLLGIVRLTTNVEHVTWSQLFESEKTDSIVVQNDSSATVVPAENAEVAANGDVAATKNVNDTVSYQLDEEQLRLSPFGGVGKGFQRILSVANYDKAFPDQNDVQLTAAQRYGVSPVTNREDAEKRKSELVFVGSNPYFHVDRLRSSIPYLVPRAAVLLQDIGRAYYDSLTMKGVPLHKIITTSILRTKEDVEKLRLHNLNATENSCHLYGTTVDIAQNRFITVEDPDGPHRRQVTNDTLKWVLTEVLRDMREQGRCYVKYERKQGCFHLTVR